MPRRSKQRAAHNFAKGNATQAKPAKLKREPIARIRERREQIYQREGTLSDSSLLIREARNH